MKKMFLCLVMLTTQVFAKEILLNVDNTVNLRGPVTSESVSEVMQELNTVAKLGKAEDPIYLVLNTPGGSVSAGLHLMEYMNSLRRPVHVVSIFAASMGFHILQSSSVRYVTKYGTIMSHRASGGFQGEIPQQVQSRFKHTLDVLDKMDTQVISRTKGKYNKKSYMELIRDEYWAVGSDGIKDGFVDEVANLKCEPSLNVPKQITIQTMFGQINATFSQCPLITQPIAVDNASVSIVMESMNKIRALEF